MTIKGFCNNCVTNLLFCDSWIIIKLISFQEKNNIEKNDSTYYSVLYLIGSLWADISDNNNRMIQLTDAFCELFKNNRASYVWLQ